MINHKGIAIIEDNEVTTFEELNKIIKDYSCKIPKNIKAAVFSENSTLWIKTIFTLWNIGAIAIPLDCKYNADELNYILEDAKPDILFISDQTEIVAKNIKDNNIIIINLKDISQLPKIYKDEDTDIDIKKTAIICYSSGTTGSPKGVELSRENIITSCKEIEDNTAFIKKGQKHLVVLPFHHMYPLTNNLFAATLFIGATAVILNDLSSKSIEKILSKHSISATVVVPKILEVIHQNIINKINSNLLTKNLMILARKYPKIGKIIFGKIRKKFNIENIVSGGAKLDIDVEKDLNIFKFNIIQGYGLTEAAPTVSVNPIKQKKVGSVGKPLTINEVKIIDGEIVVKGNNIMKGYYNKIEKTKEVLNNNWLYTGDLGYFDKEGYLYITGRKKDMIVLSNGKNIYPEEIENNIKKISKDILEIAVLDIKENLNVIIFCKENKNEIKNIILNIYNKTAISYKKIVNIYFLDEEFPKTRIGKVKKFQLRSMILEENKKKKIPYNKIESNLYNFIEGTLKKSVYQETELKDLYLDSIESAEFINYTNKNFNLSLTYEDFIKIETFSELTNKINLDDKIKVNKKIQLNQMNHFSKFVFNIISFVLKKLFIIESEIPNFEDNYIIAPNHVSYFDAFLLSTVLPKDIFYKTYFIAKSKHTKGLIFSNLSKISNIVSVNEYNLFEKIPILIDILKKGDNLVIFPEGTRSKVLGEFKKTFAYIAKETNKKIIPVVIKYKGRKVKIDFLESISPEKKSYEDLIEETKNKIKDKLEVKS